MHDQQQNLKAENKALKEQIKEIIKNQRHPDADKKPQPVSNGTESDHQFTENEREEINSPWNTVARRRRNRKHAMRTPTRNESASDSRERVVHRTLKPKHQQPRDEPVWRRNRPAHSNHFRKQSRRPREEDQRRSRYIKTREQQRYHHARAVNDETLRFYRTERLHGFTLNEPCYNCGLSNHDTNECYFRFPITCRSCGREGLKVKCARGIQNFVVITDTIQEQMISKRNAGSNV